MHKLSKSETRLLVFFLAAVFVAANVFALRYALSSRSALQREITQLQARIAEDQSWIESSANDRDTAAWVAGHQAPRLSEDSASSGLVDAVRRSADAQQLAITAETLLPSTVAGNFTGANLQIKLSGPFPGVVRLLFDLQRPDAWRSIDKLTLRSEATPPNTVLEFQIRQYHTAPSLPAASANP